jgi:ubiquinone/menaquinone biosynthesis C-methylase UbiE
MDRPDFDPAAYRAQQRANWDAVSTGWATWREHIERGTAPVTARLLELAGVRPGQAVLDIATGYGEPAISAARLVGPSGRVVGVDSSPGMLETARRRAAELPNVEFVVGDLESTGVPAGAFDVVLSRFGLMFAVDHVVAFRGVAEALVPGGVLAAATWGPPATHQVNHGPAALGELLELPAPAPGSPGMYSMSDPARLADELAAAGFVDVAVTEQIAPFAFDSVEEYVHFYRTNLPPPILDLVRRRFGTVDAPEAWTTVAQAVDEYVAEDGSLSLPSIALCLRGVKPESA